MKDKTFMTYNLFYFIYFGAIGCITPYINVYLESSRGLNGTQIGLITSLSLIIGVCVVPIWGIIGDKTQKYTIVLKLTLCCCFVVLYFYYNALAFSSILACAILLEIPRLGIIPMSDTITIEYCHQKNLNYGTIRAIGSLGYMLFAMLVGFLGESIGLDGALFGTYAILLGMSISIALTFKENKNQTNNHEDGFSFRNVKQLITYKPYLFILGITMITCIIMDGASTYNGNHLVTTLGASQSTISWLTFSTVLPEVAFLGIVYTIINKIGYKKYYVFAISTMIFRLSIYAFTSNIYLYILASCVHCFAVAIQTVVSFKCLKTIVKPSMFATAITLFTAATTLSRAIYGYFFGFVYQYATSYTMYQCGLIILFIALFIVFRTKQFEHFE